MFVDLVGSTALSTRLDPEEMGRVIRVCQLTETALSGQGQIVLLNGGAGIGKSRC